MRARINFALAIATSLLASCGRESTGDGGKTPAEPAPGSVVDAADGITFYTPEFEVPTGDSFTCIYTSYSTSEELTIVNGDGKQGAGGHHIIAYFADQPREPGVHKCADEEMTNLNQIAGSAGDGGQVLGLPEGLALKVPADKQIVLQAHYINTSGKAHTTRDWAKISKGDPSKVKSFVNYFVTNDDAFQLEPNAPMKRTSDCLVDQDFQIALGLPHMHELGKHFKLDLLDEKGTLVETLIDTDWQASYASHPPVQTWPMSAPRLFKKGQRLRQTCEWDNSTTDPVLFPREMCLSFFYYWPGNGDLNCKMTPVTAP